MSRYSCRRLPDYVGGHEHRIEIASRPRGVIGHGRGSASDEEELGSRPACSQFGRQVIEKRADVLPRPVLMRGQVPRW